jgi:hypothetical protein
MNILETIKNAWNTLFKVNNKQTPADFRRGVRKHNVIGYSIDRNSANRGLFMGGIVPMKRRFKGVSRTAKK